MLIYLLAGALFCGKYVYFGAVGFIFVTLKVQGRGCFVMKLSCKRVQVSSTVRFFRKCVFVVDASTAEKRAR